MILIAIAFGKKLKMRQIINKDNLYYIRLSLKDTVNI